jgi:hypothetical protein
MKGPEIKKATYAGLLYPAQGDELEKYIQYLINSIRVDVVTT